MLQLQSQLVFVISIFFSIKVQNIYFEGNMQVKFKFVRLLYNLWLWILTNSKRKINVLYMNFICLNDI